MDIRWHTLTFWTHLLLMAVLSHSLAWSGQEPGSSSSKQERRAVTQPTSTPPVYKPPLKGAPGGRVGGGTRGIQSTNFTLAVLAPNHAGLTVTDQPILYWYISKSISEPMEFTIMDETTTPVLETQLMPPAQPGVQRLSLSDYGVHLANGKQYHWSVTLVVDATRRSKDILAAATIEREDLPEGDNAKLSGTDRLDAVNVYAQAGHWYDALASISALIEANPDEAILRQYRAGLLQQIGLNDIAEADLAGR